MPNQFLIAVMVAFVAGFFLREIIEWIRSTTKATTSKQELPSRPQLDYLVKEFAPKGLWTPVTELGGNRYVQIYAMTHKESLLDELLLTEGGDMMPEKRYTVKEALEENIVSFDEVAILITNAICHYNAKRTWEPDSRPGNTYAIS